MAVFHRDKRKAFARRSSSNKKISDGSDAAKLNQTLAGWSMLDHVSITVSDIVAFLRDPDGNRIEAVCHHAV